MWSHKRFTERDDESNSKKIKMDYITSEIIEEIIDNAYDAIYGASSNDKSANEIDTSDCRVAEIISQVIESAYNAYIVQTTGDRSTDAKDSDEKGHKIQSSLDVGLQSKGSAIVDYVDKIDACNVNAKCEKAVDINAPYESDESIVIDCIEICKIEYMPSTEIVSDEPYGMMRVEEKREADTDGRSPIVDETVCKSQGRDEFYSTDELQSRGYLMKFSGDVQCVTNFSLPTDTVGMSKIQCRGLPPDITPNKLIPMLEKSGRIRELKFMAPANGVVTVTFSTDREANNAVKMLNGQIVLGRPVTVEKLDEMKTLFVKPIPITATKADLSAFFRKLTSGLVQLYLLYSHDHPTNNRGYCYLTYTDNDSASNAKKIIAASTYAGQKLICYWKEKQGSSQEKQGSSQEKYATSRVFLTPPPYKLYMNNLHPGLTTSDLREWFSVFGDVTEVDKNGNWASVKFRHPNDTKRAYDRIDRKLLGNDSVQISLKVLME